MIDYSKVLSQRVCNVSPSGIRKFFDLLEDKKDAIALTVGQPDFVTPWHIREAAINSLEQGKTYYTSNLGLAELRGEITNYYTRRFGITYDPKKEVIVTVGGSEAIDLAVRAIIEPGDEVIIPMPSFVCYAPITSMVGGVPVPIDLREEDSFKLTPELLRAAITEKTKLLVLPFPNNPTGSIMEEHELEQIAEVLRGTNIMVLSDEIYAELTFGKKHVSIASLEGMRERTVIVNGFSKTYAMTGWRMGYTLAPEEISYQMFKIHQYAIMCSPTTSQFAAIEAVKNGDEDIEYMAGEYDKRRKYIYEGLRSIGFDCFEPEGAFYIFPNVKKFGMSSEEFCQRLLEEKGVAIVPGSAFGKSGEGFARISYAYSVQHIKKALERMEEFVREIEEEK